MICLTRNFNISTLKNKRLNFITTTVSEFVSLTESLCIYQNKSRMLKRIVSCPMPTEKERDILLLNDRKTQKCHPFCNRGVRKDNSFWQFSLTQPSYIYCYSNPCVLLVLWLINVRPNVVDVRAGADENCILNVNIVNHEWPGATQRTSGWPVHHNRPAVCLQTFVWDALCEKCDNYNETKNG